MTESASRRNLSAVRLVIFLWSGLYLALTPFRSMYNGDLLWQSWLGDYLLRRHELPQVLGRETFTAQGAPWIAQEWLFSLLVAAAMRHGLLIALAAVMVAVSIAIFISIYARARRYAGAGAVAVVILCTGCAMMASFGVRAQVLGWACFAAFLLLLERRDPWSYAAAATVALWANLHASAALAPTFLFLRVAGGVADRGLAATVKERDVRILGLSLVAMLCTPFGWHLPAYAVMLVNSPIRHFIVEWQPVRMGSFEFLFGGLPIALLVAAGGWRNAVRQKRETLPLAFMFVVMLMAMRNVPLFAIAAAPLAARNLTRLVPSISRLSDRIAGMERVALLSCGLAFAACAVVLIAAAPSAPRTSGAAVASLAAGGAPRRIFCENFSDCSAALRYGNLSVFLDGRADPYPLRVWKSYLSVIRVEPSWRRVLNAYDVNAVVAPRASGLAKALAADPSWTTEFTDPTFVAYVRAETGSKE